MVAILPRLLQSKHHRYVVVSRNHVIGTSKYHTRVACIVMKPTLYTSCLRRNRCSFMGSCTHLLSLVLEYLCIHEVCILSTTCKTMDRTVFRAMCGIAKVDLRKDTCTRSASSRGYEIAVAYCRKLTVLCVDERAPVDMDMEVWTQREIFRFHRSMCRHMLATSPPCWHSTH